MLQCPLLAVIVLKNINYKSNHLIIIRLKIGIMQTALGLLNKTIILVIRDRYAPACFP
jgi:hypothetical protein